MTSIKTFDEFLDKLKDFKDSYSSKEIKVSAPTLFTLIMAGAFDSLLESEPTVMERFQMIDRVKRTLKSTASLETSRKDTVPLSEIDSDLSRKMWLAKINPAFVFRISDYYQGAMSTMGYSDTGRPNLRFRRGQEDIFTNFGALFLERSLRFYGNKNVDRLPGIIAVYNGYTTQAYDRGKFIKVVLYDGTEEMQATIWPAYGTQDKFDPALINALKTYKKKTCIVIGRIGKSKRGFNSFTVKEMRLIG